MTLLVRPPRRLRPGLARMEQAGATEAGRNLLARLLALAALTVSTLLVGRTLGPEGLGALALLRVLPWLVGVVLGGGLYGAAPYFLSGSGRGDAAYRSTFPAMALVAGVVGCGVWLALAPGLQDRLFPQVAEQTVMIAGAAVLTQLLETTAKACSQGTGDLPGANRIIVLEELVFVPLYVLLYMLQPQHAYVAMVLALVGGDVVTASVGWVRLRARGFFTGSRPDLRHARSIAAFGIRAEVGSIVLLLNARLDFAIVGLWAGPAQLGIYAVASRYAELLRLPGLALNYVLYPAYARAGATSGAEASAREAVRRIGWVPAALAVPMALLAPVLIPLAYGSAFRAAVLPSWILLVGLAGSGLTGIVAAFLSADGRPGLASTALGVGLVVTVAGDLALIPQHGIIGASIASAAAYLTTTAAMWLFFAHLTRRVGREPPRVKRCFDVAVAGAALVLLAPVLAVLALAVRLGSPGPVLFRQVRVGQGGRPFELLKFRTMVVGADRLAANVSPDGDPRITRVGRLLRRWYLDELPQLVNVVRGDMSLVGPRPETPEFVALMTEDERRLLTVRGGLVGPSTLAFMDEAEQLAGVDDAERYYRETLLHRRAQADLAYLECKSLRFDLSLLARQALAILRSD
jgi:lipopolysaccharide/colanic/teichoic acid biosynthesis glycosyltransferase